MNYCAVTLSDWWSRGLESGSTWIALAVVFAGFGGLVFGWLIGRPSAAERQEVAESDNDPLTDAALRWRHEKLILTERQQREARERTSAFSEFLVKNTSNRYLGYTAALFALAEAVRGSRQIVGTDFSRHTIVNEQLTLLQDEANVPRPDAIVACKAMSEKQIGSLKKSREVLKGISAAVLPLEDEVFSGREFSAESVDGAREALTRARELAGTLPPGWEVAASETDRQIRDSLKAGKETTFDSLTSIILVDGSVSSSLASDQSRELSLRIQATLDELNDAPAEALEVASVELPEADASDEPENSNGASHSEEVAESEGSEPATEKPDGTESSWENPFLQLTPDDGFRSPKSVESSESMAADFSIVDDTSPIQKPLKKTARISGFTDLTKDASSGELPAEPEAPEPDVSISEEVNSEEESLLLFRSNDVGIWGKTVYRGANCRARSLESLPDWADWISMKRLDTDERVFVHIDGDSFTDPDRSTSIGFNASNELFYGARHLGVFSETCPNEVETRFTYGGWGFGHRVSPEMNSAESLQAVGWEGKEISSDTIFEICLHRELPEKEPGDRVLKQS